MTESQGHKAGREGLIIALPVLFVDEWVPRLKDTELRVMLSVLRQTGVIGKESPTTWLTHSELRRRTGRASEAISSAVDGLAKQGLLEVLDEAGDILRTPVARRNAVGRRLYRVAALTAQAGNVESLGRGKPKTIESKEIFYSLRFSDDPPSRQERLRIEAEKKKIRDRLRRLGPAG